MSHGDLYNVPRGDSPVDLRREFPHIGSVGTKLAILALSMAVRAPAVELKPETRAAFERYVREAESRIQTLAGRP